MFEDLNQRAKSLHEIRLQFCDDREYCVLDGEGNPRDNPYLDLKRSQMEKECPHPDNDLLSLQQEMALVVFDNAEEVVREMLSSKRLIANCFVDGYNVNARLVYKGLALAYRKYSKQFIPEEDKARVAKRGMWAGEFVAPWDWRKGKRLTSE